ncbi:MAG: FtsX-like permease family protein [Oscillospiraceae bacterium]|nr:FtsX-like permease family protein [Oscillospiraceae bacterium]
MAKQALKKDLFREISKTRSRFISIFVLVALAVAFLAGLRTTAPDMEATADAYLDRQNMMDIQIMATLGITQEDIDALAARPGVLAAEGAYTADGLVPVGDNDLAVKVVSLSEQGLNQPNLIRGRLPENPGECLTEESLLEAMEADLGVSITINTGTGTYEDALTRESFTVVGTCQSPLYLSIQRGSSSLGTGHVSCFVLLPKDAFDMEAYTEAYATLEGAKERNAYSDGYEALVDRWVDENEAFGDGRARLRSEDIREEAEEKLADAQKEYDDAEAEVNQELADAAQELADGRQELDDGWKEYNQGWADLRRETADAERELAGGEQELADAKVELEDGEKEYADGLLEYEDGEKEYADGLKEYEDGEAEYAGGLAEWKDGEQKYLEGVREYEDGRVKYAEGLRDYEQGKKDLEEGWKEYADGVQEYEDGLKRIQDGWKAYYDGQRDYENGAKKLEDGWAEYNDGRKEYEEGQRELSSADSQLNDAWRQLQDARAQLDAGWAEYHAQTAGAEAQLSSLREQLPLAQTGLSQAQEGLAQAEAGLSQAQDYLNSLDPSDPAYAAAVGAVAAAQGYVDQASAGVAQAQGYVDQISSGITQIEQGLAAGRAQLDAGEREYSAGYAQYQAGADEYEAGRRQLAEAKKQLDEAKEELEAGEEELAEARRQLREAKEELEAGAEELTEAKQELDSAKQELADGEVELAEGKRELDEAARELAEADQELTDAKKELDDGWAELEDGRKELDDAKQEILDGRKELDDAKQELLDARQELDDGWKEYNDGLVELADGRRELAEETAKARKELADAKVELEDGEQEYAGGLLEYEDGKAEAQTGLADARSELRDARRKVNGLDDCEWYLLGRKANIGFVSYQQDAERMGNLASVFPLLFFLVAALVCLTTMTRMVEEQRSQIGCLKALGYSRRDIAQKYVGYGLLASVSGGIAGLAVGCTLIPWVIIRAWRIMYNIPGLVFAFQPGICGAAVLAAVGCTAVAVLAAALNAVRAGPASLMRPKAPKAGKRVLLERVGFVWKRLSFSHKVTVRNLFRYKRRFWMTVIGIAGCTALIVTGFGIRDSILDIMAIQYDELYEYHAQAALVNKWDEEEFAEVADWLDQDERVARWRACNQTAVDFEGAARTMDGNLIVVGSGAELEGFVKLRTRLDHAPVSLPDRGLLMTEKLAELLDVGIGDTVTLVNGDHRAEAEIGALTEQYIMHYAYLTDAYYQELFGEAAEDNVILISYTENTEELSSQVSSGLIALDGVTSVTRMENTRRTFSSSMESVDYAVVLIIVCAAALAFVVLFNLTNINITERMRELATLKVLGFNDREMGAYVYRENVLLTFFGVALGLVIGKFLHQWLVLTVEVDMVMFGRSARPISYVYAVGLTVLFSMLVNLFANRKLRKIDMVESLKSVE